MKAIVRVLLVLIGLVLNVASIEAQTPFQAGVNFLMGFPQNEFSKNVDNPGFGLSGHFGYQIPQSPISLGASLGF